MKTFLFLTLLLSSSFATADCNKNLPGHYRRYYPAGEYLDVFIKAPDGTQNGGTFIVDSEIHKPDGTSKKNSHDEYLTDGQWHPVPSDNTLEQSCVCLDNGELQIDTRTKGQDEPNSGRENFYLAFPDQLDYSHGVNQALFYRQKDVR